MILLKDFRGKEVRLTDERLSHILRHSEMIGQEKLIAETLLMPDSVILSHYDSKVHLYHKLFDKTPVTRKYLIVAVKYIEHDAFIITSFFTSKEKKGTIVWTR